VDPGQQFVLDLIDRAGTQRALTDKLKVPASTVRSWKKNGVIEPSHWPDIKRFYGLTPPAQPAPPAQPEPPAPPPPQPASPAPPPELHINSCAADGPMLPFASATEMLRAHQLMFGAAGQRCAEIVLDWAPRLFTTPIDPLTVRIVLAPVEIGPYNRHRGYHAGDGSTAFILLNRHHVRLGSGGPEIVDEQALVDVIVHELTHTRQKQLFRANGWSARSGNGVHRDRGWYTAVAEACPNYLGVPLPQSVWPTGRRTRAGTLTEVEMTHWPNSIRELAQRGDPRL
jgi:hypothetical protein